MKKLAQRPKPSLPDKPTISDIMRNAMLSSQPERLELSTRERKTLEAARAIVHEIGTLADAVNSDGFASDEAWRAWSGLNELLSAGNPVSLE